MHAYVENCTRPLANASRNGYRGIKFFLICNVISLFLPSASLPKTGRVTF